MRKYQSNHQSSRFFICFLLLTLTLAWSIFAFGSAFGQYREIAVFLTAISAGLSFFILPKNHWLPRLGPVAWTSLGFLLCFGWFMVFNAKAEHSIEQWSFTTLKDRLIPFGPGSVTKSSSFYALRELSAVVMAIVAIASTTQTKAWKWVIGLIAVMGAITAGIGIFHKIVGAKAVWFVDEWHAGSFFAPYIYNANAAALMNLSCTLALGFFFGQRESSQVKIHRGIWLTIASLSGVGVMVAGSKGAILILVFILILSFFLNRKRFIKLIRSEGKPKNLVFEKRIMMTFIAAIILSLGVISSKNLTSRTQTLFNDIDRDGYSESVRARLAIMGLMVKMSSPSEGSWPGFGPGSFQHIVPYFTNKPGFEIKGRWMHGHCDPLQTTVEWGYLGSAAWLTFGVGSVVAGLRSLSRKTLASIERPIIRSMMIALTATGLHSCFDFPLSIYSIHLCAMILCGILWGLSTKEIAL